MKSLMLDELRVGTGGGPLTLVMSLLTHSPLSLDLGVHQDLLSLAGNLLSGACLSALKQGQSTPSKIIFSVSIQNVQLICPTNMYPYIL